MASPSKVKKIVHVNQHVIRDNRKHNKNNPVITVKQGRRNSYTNNLLILDKTGVVIAKLVYRPQKPLSCGARCWLETDCEVVLTEEECIPHGACRKNP